MKEEQMAIGNMAYKRPICPLCEEEMVRCHYQNEEGDWFVCWLCGCKPEAEAIAAVETMANDAS